MRIAIVQLSDIHIRSSNDAVLGRANKISSAARSVIPNPDAYLLGVIGDVAFSGTGAQYELALQFLTSLKEELLTSGKPVHLFLVPGNHDLDFTLEPDTRAILLQSVRENVYEINRDGETVRQILLTQQPFFEFESRLCNSPIWSIAQQLAHVQLINVSGKTIYINCYNTAWVSTKPELPNLVFPVENSISPPSPNDLSISVFHHPYNWLEPENARLFRHQIETSSDVVLTGHEHESAIYVKLDSSGVATQYIEGSVLQQDGNGHSAFNVVLLDDVQSTYEAFKCEWDGAIYSPSAPQKNQFIRNKLLCTAIFRNNDGFFNSLNDPGLPILHPRKRDVKLDDLYVYPSLTRKNPDKSLEMLSVVESPDILEHVRKTQYMLIAGDDTIGKTSLCKKLYRDLHAAGDLIPILMSGNDFEGVTEANVRKCIRYAIAEQYDEFSIERYLQLDRAQRVLIIDDWHRLKYASRGRGAICDHLKVIFGKIICVTNRLYALDELAEPGIVKTAFADSDLYEIRAFGRRLTGKLIESWHSLGREYAVDEKEYHYAVAMSENKIAAVIGSGILPTYPIFLIGLLQVDTAPNSAAQNAGSYGHILESLITSRMADVSAKSSDIGTMYTYVSRIGYAMFKLDRSFLSAKEMSDLHAEYCSAYKMNLSELRIVPDLVRAKILIKDGDSFRFRYRGCYCYFVARYFYENLSSNDLQLRAELNDITDKLVWDDYTNILMFFLYLTRDVAIIERLLNNASDIYRECEPCDLENDVVFVNKLLTQKPNKLILPSTNIASNRDQFRGEQDARGNEGETESLQSQRVPYDTSLNEITKINIALQSLRVMGQVLRNFPGVLTAQPKYRLAEASYMLGLRTLRRLLELAQSQMEALRIAFAQTFKEKFPFATQEEVETSADEKLIWLTGAVSYGIIKKICRSIGLQDLELTFQEVLQKHGNRPSVKLVDLSIKLEHFRDAPEADISDLERSLRRNLFSYKILRQLIAEYLYLYNTDRTLGQRLGDLFEIKVSDPRYLLNKAVKTHGLSE